MTYSYKHLVHPGIQTLTPYVPGKSIESLAKERGLTDIIKLASNENPLGCSPAVRQALANMSSTTIATYPDYLNHPLRHKLAERHQVTPENIALSHGTDFIFWFLLTLFGLGNTKKVLTHSSAFLSYSVQAKTQGIPVITTPLKDNYEVDMDSLIAHCNDQVSLIFLANPNNPTAQWIPLEEIERLLTHLAPGTLLVLDEAYHEYTGSAGTQDSIALQKRFPSLILTRTFSKLYGLASLRIGYAIANPEIIELLHRVQPPFTVSQAAMIAASAALDDEAFVCQTLSLNEESKLHMQQGLDKLGLNYLPSYTNFITFDCGNPSLPIYDALLSQGVIVRPLNAYGMPNHLRVTLGTAEQNQRFLRALEGIY